MANAIPVHSMPQMSPDVSAPTSPEVTAEGSTNFLPLLADEGDLGNAKAQKDIALDVPLKERDGPQGREVPIFTHKAVRVDF